MRNRPLPMELRPVDGFPMVECLATGFDSEQRSYAARKTVLTVQPAWWQRRMGVAGPFVLYALPGPMASVGERVMLGQSFGHPMGEPVEEIRLFTAAGEKRAVVRNHVWVLEE